MTEACEESCGQATSSLARVRALPLPATSAALPACSGHRDPGGAQPPGPAGAGTGLMLPPPSSPPVPLPAVGTVNKVGHDHLGLLVLGCINVSLPADQVRPEFRPCLQVRVAV